MHWRRFATKDIPTHDEKAFGDWLLLRWREKDDLIDHYLAHGRFPADEGIDATPDESGKIRKGAGWIETEVQPKSVVEVLTMLVPLAAFALVVNVLLKFWSVFASVLRAGA